MGQQCVRDTCQRDDRSNELVFGGAPGSTPALGATYAPPPAGAVLNTNPNLGSNQMGMPGISGGFAGPMMGLTPGTKPPLITPTATVDIFVAKDELGRRQGYGRIEELGYQYEGQFKDDYKEGSGTLTWPDGRQYQVGF